MKEQLDGLMNEDKAIGEYLSSLDNPEYHELGDIPLSIDGKKHLLSMLEEKTNGAIKDTTL